MKPGFVRIIAGKWRGRRLQIPAVKNLRPTPDSVRETLFNWLQPYLPGARCLDLFAGSGAFGFEALSRGAAFVEMVDQSAEVVAILQAALANFDDDHAHIYQAIVPQQLQRADTPFDIAFLDPPYQGNLLLPTCAYLEAQGYLATDAYIYLEAAQAIKDNEVPATWRIIKSKQAGQVFYHLAKRNMS